MNNIANIDYLEGSEFQKARAFSPAVITSGASTVWLAGQTTTTDQEGKDISGQFEAQAVECFRLIDVTLKRVGSSLEKLVSMTVFITDPRYGDQFVTLRARQFSNGRFPASALITVSHFARPGILIEIQGVAVI